MKKQNNIETIDLLNLVPIKINKSKSTNTFTFTKQGFYINKNLANEIKFDFTENVVVFKHPNDLDSIILILINNESNCPSQWKNYMKKFKQTYSYYKGNQTFIGYSLQCLELTKDFPYKYNIQYTETIINNFEAIVCKLIKN